MNAYAPPKASSTTPSSTTPSSTTPSRRAEPLALGMVYLLLILLLTGAAVFCTWVAAQRVTRLYQDHVYPNVYALGTPLGGLTPDEARAALAPQAEGVDAGMLILTDGDRRWTYAWSEAGMQVDIAAMVEAAYAVGRDGTFLGPLGLLLRYHDVRPRFTVDAEAARGLLAQVSEEASRPPVEPTIQLDQGEVVVVPGEVGRVVDISSTLLQLMNVQGNLHRVEVPLVFAIVPPAQPDTAAITAQAEVLLSRTLLLSAYDVLTEETLTWTLDRDDIAGWLHLVPGPQGELTVNVNRYAVRDTLMALAEGLGDGRGFRFEPAAERVFDAFNAQEPSVRLYLTHPPRTYIVQPGDTLTRIAEKVGMPPGRLAEANAEIDIDHLHVGQQIVIPSQDVLTPYMPVPGKKIVVSRDEQRVRVYEKGALLWDWPVSTGKPASPTAVGTFQIISKKEQAYASQWDLWMPYFMGVYEVTEGGVTNGFHELPILSSGERLWAGALGHPASFGCIILGIPEAETLYAWAELGVVVVIE
jgi:lipoprotein-anchoring transpeptidase ErfK/SrfK